MATRTGLFRYCLMGAGLVAALGLVGTLLSLAQSQGPPPGTVPCPDRPASHTIELILEGDVFGGFIGISGLVSENEVLEFREGTGDGIVKIPGDARFGDITLVRGLTGIDALWEWRLEVVDGVFERRNGTIIFYDSMGAEVQRWNFINGWPSKWEGPTLTPGSNVVAVESITITVESLDKG